MNFKLNAEDKGGDKKITGEFEFNESDFLYVFQKLTKAERTRLQPFLDEKFSPTPILKAFIFARFLRQQNSQRVKDEITKAF